MSKMLSVRLTGSMRDAILDRALRAAFTKDETALAEAESALATRCYEAVYPADTRAKAAAMPDGWLRRDWCLRFAIGYRSVELKHIHGFPVPWGGGSCRQNGSSITDVDLIAAFDAFEASRLLLKRRKSEAAEALRKLLISVSTVKALKAAWPEGQAHYAIYEQVAPSTALVASTEKLNALLGLAPVVAEAVQS